MTRPLLTKAHARFAVQQAQMAVDRCQEAIAYGHGSAAELELHRLFQQLAEARAALAKIEHKEK